MTLHEWQSCLLVTRHHQTGALTPSADSFGLPPALPLLFLLRLATAVSPDSCTPASFDQGLQSLAPVSGALKRRTLGQHQLPVGEPGVYKLVTPVHLTIQQLQVTTFAVCPTELVRQR
ncbi:hypothetical protein SprV_0301095800 [Sparganum proliferum]